jgi:hypothetical protein
MNFAIIYMFSYALKNSWTMWDCVPLRSSTTDKITETYVLQDDPSIQCFSNHNMKWIGFAIMSLFLVIGYSLWAVFIYLRLLLSMRKLAVVERRLGFLYLVCQILSAMICYLVLYCNVV